MCLTRKSNNIQCRAIRREFEHVGPTLLKNLLGAGWGLLPTLQWMGSLIFPSSREKSSQLGIELPTPLFRFRVPLQCRPVVQGHLGPVLNTYCSQQGSLAILDVAPQQWLPCAFDPLHLIKVVFMWFALSMPSCFGY